MSRNVHMIDEAELSRRISEEFKLGSGLGPQLQFVDDLGLDSVDMLSLVVFIEELAGADGISEPHSFPVICCMHDAYLYFTQIAASGSGLDDP